MGPDREGAVVAGISGALGVVQGLGAVLLAATLADSGVALMLHSPRSGGKRWDQARCM
ncbi:hypothetical protein LX15_002325 [Streptoalloteichus tenebrarius]|uniref:Uncharacterized protein n=1 Tax=Streptoalloteichus tenebrarius (strain ATCC 17920 / DSM 40477 / JCM 4838 / CBS 697.72 / NBRC 16177 / NCIMB 11028 / NRRL B-12390 / A12253. 1 / ISP 5477) TaxID=1933 RepID=A0ABT1HSZ9_STRSD|nr:hypothetical protein [Streptoalloteichus tenebrarius]